MNELLLRGFDLMIIGMGVVFSFLLVLVFLTSLMSRLVLRFEPAPAAVPAPRVRKPASPAHVDAHTLAVIQDAIHQHRARQK